MPASVLAAFAPEVAAALIAGVVTVGVAVWQTTGSLKEQARISADAARDQAKLTAATTLMPLRTVPYGALWSLLDVGPADAPAAGRALRAGQDVDPPTG
jgi:hypothetical protein